MRATLLVPTTATLLLAACTMSPPLGAPVSSAASSPAAPSSAQPGAQPDVDGDDWLWTNRELLRMPPFVALMVGVVPEGPNTHARCESGGTMTLVQAGDTFSGSAQRTSNACETNGGQSFQQPGALFQITDGRITGGAVHFSFAGGIVTPCPHRAVMSTVQGGRVTSLTGTGRCVLPGHPQSDSPVQLDPPPGGTSETIDWTATRP